MSLDVKAKQVLDRACLDLARHSVTRAFAPFFMDGKMLVDNTIPTAATDGFKEMYNAQFLLDLPTDGQRRFLVLHEKTHKFLMHMLRLSPRMKENFQIANIAMDYAGNGLIIENILPQAPDLLERIPSALYDVKYSGWAYEDIFDDLMKDMKRSGKSPAQYAADKGSPLDGHQQVTVEQMSDAEIGNAMKDVTESLRQGQMMAGKDSAANSLSVENALAPQVDWRREMQEFFTEAAAGRDELTFRRFNRRAVANDIYLPTMEAEVLEEMVAAFDVSGSMVDMLPLYAAALQDAALVTKPGKIRILWWDTQVASEQVFTDYENLAVQMRPVGGGGTRLGCVSDYILAKGMAPSSLLVFTDGEVEGKVDWRISCPALWFVHGSKRTSFSPPSGRLVSVTE